MEAYLFSTERVYDEVYKCSDLCRLKVPRRMVGILQERSAALCVVHEDGIFRESLVGDSRSSWQMKRVVGIDHISVRVSDFERSKAFYSGLFAFLGLEAMDEYDGAMGWSNGKTRYWIGQADAKGVKHKHHTGDIGLHHYAFQLRSRKDVDDLQDYLRSHDVTIVDPADVYYDNYYAVFFLDPDGIKLEGMKYGEEEEKA